jgi:ubiquitin fusion degradation protein 1
MTSVVFTLKCHSVSLLAAEQQRDSELLEYADKIILPPSCLEKLAHLEISYPMLFEATNPHYPQRRLHCGVLEFVALEGMVYLPFWMMENMHLREGGALQLRSASIRKGLFVKLQPQTTDFIRISNPKAVLEQATVLKRPSTLPCLAHPHILPLEHARRSLCASFRR